MTESLQILVILYVLMIKSIFKMNKEIAIPTKLIMNKIFLIRGQKIILDRYLAELYQVETKYLKRQVRRNIEILCLS